MTDVWESDLSAIEAEFPVTFEFSGKELTGSAGELAEDLIMQDAGYVQGKRRSLIALLSRFTDASVPVPRENETVTIGSNDYRIETITGHDTISIQMTLLLVT